MLLWQLFLSFTRIGTFTFGGGYAMLPMIKKEIVQKQGWASEAEIADYFAIGQVTPGVIAVNTATFVGYKVAGLLGGIVATLGVIITPIIIITLIAAFLSNFTDLAWVNHAFNGIRACVCILIFDSVYSLAKRAVMDRVTWGIFLSVSLLTVFSLLSPVLVVLLAGLVGVISQQLRATKQQESSHD